LTPQYEPVELEEFLENGKRGWDAIYYGNASDKFGIYPAGSNNIKSEEKRDAVNNTGTIYYGTSKPNFIKNFFNKIWNRK